MRCWWLGLIIALLTVGCQAEEMLISTGDYPPWTGKQLPGGGFANRVVTEAFKRQHISVRFHYVPWTRALAELRSGEAQASSYWAANPARDRDFYLSDAILENRVLLFYRKERPLPKWRQLSDLHGLSFGLTRSYTYTAELWRLVQQGTLKAQIAPDDELTMHNLLNGSVAVVPMDEMVEKMLLSSRPFPPGALDRILTDPKPLFTVSGYLFFARTPEGLRLRQRFNAGLAQMKQDGTWAVYYAQMLKSMNVAMQLHNGQ